ncbi:MAG TPA: hypothetical protein DCR70_06385 [Phycisphaerales bacterium]|nr:hypothetical protein [Phycisphaerales bacterium]
MNFAFKRRFRALNLATRTAWRNRGRPRIPGPWVPGSQHPDSLLLITLDSCRFDTLSSCSVPVISGVGPIHKVMAPSYFTYASHAAMFVGFTPGDGLSQEAIVNPKCGKLVRLHGGGSPSRANDRFVLRGRSMMEGFNNAGYITAGTGAVKWFDDSSDVGRLLVQDFQHYMYAGNAWSLRKQLQWLSETVGGARRPVFAFINIGETHVPYYYEGAPWSNADVTCRAFASSNNAVESARRQAACLTWVDQAIAPLVAAFSKANIMICGDHGDAWGEGGVWEHGFHHPKVMEVPMIFRVSDPTPSQAK